MSINNEIKLFEDIINNLKWVIFFENKFLFILSNKLIMINCYYKSEFRGFKNQIRVKIFGFFYSPKSNLLISVNIIKLKLLITSLF